MKRSHLLILILLVALLVPAGMWWFSPQQVIQRRTQHLMEVLSLSEGASGTLRQAKVFSMNAMLAMEVELSVPEVPDANGTFDKTEMESAFSWICQNARSSRFDVIAFRSVTIEGDLATVRCLVEGYIELGAGRPADGTHEVTLVWKKGADGWRFEKVSWITPER